ncbi:MAG: hypothetical protein FGM45_06430 [Actinobacteria bacterium]|nr:hypothetical protein [Actinomycetota bacterium]
MSMSVQPQSIRKRMRGKVRIVIRNHDEEPHKIRLRAEGDDGDTRVTLERPGVIVRPGEMVRVPARVKVKPYYIGKQKERFYSIIGEGAGVPVYARGNVRQKPMIGKNVKSLGLLGSIIIVWLTLTISVIRLVSPATQEAAVGAETGTEQPGAGGETPISPLIPVLVDVNGTVKGVPDGSGVVITWRPVALGDVSSTEGKVAGGTAVASPDVALQTTTTDAEGKFVVAGLDGAGLYEFTFSKAGHQTQTKIVQPNGQPVTLEVELVPGSGTIGGITVDEAGRALGGVDITLTDGAITYGSSTPTDGDSAGRFQFNNLSSPGTYVLDARIAGRGLASTTIELQTGQAVTDIRLVLRADVAALAGKIASAAFEGDAVAAADFRIAQATAAGRLPTFTVTATDGTLTRSTTTLSEGLLAGTFRLEQLPVNRTYTITYEAPGFLTLTEQLELTSATPERQIAMVRSTGRLRGKVTIEGSNLSPTAVAVTVANSDNTYKATDAISSDGSLLIDGIVPGRYVVTLEALGLQKQVREVEIGAGTSTTLNVTMSASKVSAIKSSLSFKVVKGGNDTTTQVVATVKSKLQTECGTVGTDKDCVYDVTLADGNLKITGLEAGGYVIEFTAVGFFPRTITTQVAPSTDVAQQEVIMVPLGSLQGQVNDDTAAPVQGVTLRLLKGAELVATTTTSATGEYLFSRKLLPTTYTVEVVSSNYSSTPRSVVGALAATLNLDVVVRGLSLITGEVKDFNLLQGEYEPYETGEFNIYLRNGMLAATWTDASTLGLAKSLGGYRVGVAPTLNADDSRVTGSSSGYDVCFVAVNTAGATISASACDAPVAGLDARISDDIDLQLTETATRSYFVSPTPGRVAGTVTVNGVAGGAGLKVEARRVDNAERIIESVSTKTTAGGVYVFTNLTPVRPVTTSAGFSLTSEASHTGCLTTEGACWIVRASAESTGYTDSGPLKIYPGSNVTISALPIVQTADSSLTITVLDQAGVPVSGVTVSATASGSSIGACGVTDNDGKCVITNPTQGVVAQVTAEKAGYRSARDSIGIIPGKLALSLTLTPARTASFTVQDSSSAVLSGVTVSATDALGGRSSCLTAVTGICALVGLAPGTAVITAEKSGYTIYSGVLAIGSDADASSIITMTVGNAGITGSVTTSPNVAIQGALLTATSGNTIVSAISNADGRFRFPGLAPGTWTVAVSAIGYASATSSAVVVAGSDTTLNFSLTALKGAVEIYVRTSGGSPIEGVTVSAYTNSGKTTLVAQGLSVNGLVTLSNFDAGQYWIVVTDGLGRFASQEFLVNIDRGYTTQLPVYLGSTKSVVVVGVAGIPAVGFGPQSTVSAVIGLEKGGDRVTTSAVAAFDRSVATFSDIANGTYNVEVDGQTAQVVIGGKTYNIPDKDVIVSGPTTVDVGLLLLVVAPVAVHVTTSAGASVTLDGGYLLTPVTATANGSGVATFANVPPGTYRTTITKTGFQTITQDIVVTDRSLNGGTFTESISLTNVAPAEVTFTTKYGADLVPGAAIRADSTGDICVTNNIGQCKLLLPPGSYSITASHPSYNDLTGTNVVVVAGTPQSITISFAAMGTGTVGFVTKTTTDSDLDGVTVTSTTTASDTCTTASSKCSISNQATRATTYRLTKVGYADTFVAATPISNSTVTVSAQMPAVSTSASVNVRVIDGISGANLSGVVVQDINDPSSPTAFCTTGAAGCTVVPTVSYGTLTLRTGLTGYATTSATVTITRDTATAIVIVVQPTTGNVEITANAASGGVVVGASVSVSGGGACAEAGAVTSASGKCTINGLSGGAVTLTVSKAGYTTETVVAGLAPGSTTAVSVSMRQTGTVTVQVSPSPSTSATFSIIGAGSPCTISNPATSCNIASIPFGTWLVSGEGYRNSSVSVSASTVTVSMTAAP